MKKQEVYKEPSLLYKIITIHYEQARRRKALRLLQKQNWSVDFLSTLLLKSARMYGSPLELTITSPNGTSMRITAKDLNEDDGKVDDTDIFNHLDDEASINDFVSRHSKR